MKKKLLKILLVVIPFMAVVLATTGDSVKLIDMATGEAETASYFGLLSDSPVAVCPVLAAFCGIFSLIGAAVFVFSRKNGFLKTSAWCAFAGACLAVVPVAARGETLLLPNVMFPILLLIHFGLCALAPKWNLDQKELAQGRRLDPH